MHALGLDDRLRQIGIIDNALSIQFNGRTIHLDLAGLTGKSITIYGQQEIVKDLVAARAKSGEPLLFEAKAIAVENLNGDRPFIRYQDGQDGVERTLDCDFIASCDGYHGMARASLPKGAIQTYDRSYDFASARRARALPTYRHRDLFQQRSRICALQPAFFGGFSAIPPGWARRETRKLDRKTVLG